MRPCELIDAPPGTACPMQTAVETTDFCLMVTEPTPFGCSDLALAIETCRELEVPVGVVVNRDGIGSAKVEDVCDQYGVPLMLRISHSREVAAAYAEGRCLVEAFPEWAIPLEFLLDEVERLAVEARTSADSPRPSVSGRGRRMMEGGTEMAKDSAGPAPLSGGKGRGGGQGQGRGRAQRGRGLGPGGSGAAPGGSCVCPSCGTKAPHVRGVPCVEMACPTCGARMVREVS